jgi:hypothetical protein
VIDEARAKPTVSKTGTEGGNETEIVNDKSQLFNNEIHNHLLLCFSIPFELFFTM